MKASYRYYKPREPEQASAKKAITDLLGKMGFEPDKFALFDLWEKETKGLIRGCEAVALQGNRLCVRVPSAVHRQELYYSKERLIARLNQAMGRKMISDIRFEFDDKGDMIGGKTAVGRRTRRFGERHG